MSNHMCSMCGGTSVYGKQGGTSGSRSNCGGQMPSIQLCNPTLAGKPPPSTGHHAPGQQPSIIQVPWEVAKPFPNFICEPCPPPPPTKVWLIKSSPVPQKSVCLPVGSSNQGCPLPPTKLMVCLPCPPHICITQGQRHNYNSSVTNALGQGGSFPFAVPQKAEGEPCVRQPPGGKYLPPPERRICSANCIHVSDVRGNKPCTWQQNIPCVAHCFET